MVDRAKRLADRTRRVLIERTRSTYRSPAGLAAIGVSATLVLALLVVIALLRTGGTDSVSTNAPLIGALIALGGVFTTQLVNTGLEAQRAQEAALQKYFEQVGELLIGKRSLRDATPSDHLGTIARAQTLTVLEGLDPERKRILLQFLYESDLIKVDKPVVNLEKANLREANLSEADLEKANLERARLKRANLSEADLKKANLKRARLRRANLSEADLKKANLESARLRRANLSEADLEKANLRSARLKRANLWKADLKEANLKKADLRMTDLREAKNLTQEQIDAACGDETTKLPDPLHRPAHWSEGSEEQLKES